MPLTTYRLQMNASFRFEDARKIVPYLKDLGISDLYLSPIFAARRGSSHGYDVIDPARLNPELGAEEDFFALAHEVKQADMGLLLDIVPNHMAASTENRWWSDVLENGRDSTYALFFDIDWTGVTDPGLRNKVMLPVLGSPLVDVIANGEISLALDEEGLNLRYYDTRLPLSPRSYQTVLGGLNRDFPGLDDAQSSPEDLNGLKRNIWDAYSKSSSLQTRIDQRLAAYVGEPLTRLIADQHYEPAFRRDAPRRINYRRFFDINDLVGVRVEDPKVFETTHQLIVRLARERVITGLRIDHVDGLFDPAQYLQRLQDATGGIYVTVEKILLGDEKLRRDWNVAGTTGYDFLSVATGLFVARDGLGKLDQSYARLAGDESISDMVHRLKRSGLRNRFQAETHSLARNFGARDDASERAMVSALESVTTALPIYRTYRAESGANREDSRYVRAALAGARRQQHASRRALSALQNAFQTNPSSSDSPGRGVMRWQQLSGAAMAKGLEDSALYIFNRLVSLNDVGSSPASIESPPDPAVFHAWNRTRQRDWPYTINATSTHDTKRSEDVRARINVLSELPSEWSRRTAKWRRLNRQHKARIGRSTSPSRNEEHLIYQTLIGAWPLTGAADSRFVQRIKDYMIKASREAGVNTSWTEIDQAYEAGLTGFVELCCSESDSEEFLEDFRELAERVAYFGGINSLAQTLLKITSPGLPDFYQGSEMWDFSLVDPDNRRPIDFEMRRRLLSEMTAEFPDTLTANWQDGRIKLFLTTRALAFRRQHRSAFTEGSYESLEVTGPGKDHVVAFARRRGKDWCIVVVPRFAATLTKGAQLDPALWRDANLLLPPGAPHNWLDCFSNEERVASLKGGSPVIPVRNLFRRFPVALLGPSKDERNGDTR